MELVIEDRLKEYGRGEGAVHMIGLKETNIGREKGISSFFKLSF